MLRSDVQGQRSSMDRENLIRNIQSINVSVMPQIQQELEPYNVISLVFLLYDTPDTALQRLIIFQRTSKDVDGRHLDLLSAWALHAQSNPDWRYEFLEALAICQLYEVIKKLGFHLPTVKNHYQPENININMYVNKTRKALYLLCEKIDSSNLLKLKKTLIAYDIDTTDYESCELVILALMCQKFISFDNVEKLIKIIENFSELSGFAQELRHLLGISISKVKMNGHITTSTPKIHVDNDDGQEDKEVDRYTGDFSDMFNLINQMQIEDDLDIKMKSDKTKFNTNFIYKIKNTKRIGVCYIINQENFHPSKDSIESKVQSQPLETRTGSTIDKVNLQKTMAALNFEVITHSDLDYKTMFQQIKNVTQYRVHHDDSIFVLCILSHGIRGHIYTADSLKVNVEEIQSLLESDDAIHLRDLPKVIILQACQVEDNEPPAAVLKADGPSNYHLKKMDFLIYWATSPELESYRHIEDGSIFIKILCAVIAKRAHQYHLYEIFTEVNLLVTHECSRLKKDQVPIFVSSLRKKLYLQIPTTKNLS